MRFDWLGATRRVRLARFRALFWAALGVLSFPLGWASSVVLVWIASVYANVESGWGSGEAADDTAVTAQLDTIKAIMTDRLDVLEAKMDHLLAAGETRGAAAEQEPPHDDQGGGDGHVGGGGDFGTVTRVSGHPSDTTQGDPTYPNG